MKILWSSTAVDDLKAIREYIANDRPAAGRRVAKRIKEAVNRLVHRPVAELADGCAIRADGEPN